MTVMTCTLASVDRHAADFLCRQAGTDDPLLWLAFALASNAVGDGHICLDLAGLAGSRIVVDGGEFAFPLWEELRGRLVAAPVVGTPGEFRPLVFTGDGRLYLYRYWRYEQQLARVIKGLAGEENTIDAGLLADGLGRLFPADGSGELDWQKVAAVAAVRKRFCVISGGPGTGKTSTVVKIIALLLEQAGGGHLRIALTAPTGKAAARLRESVAALKGRLPCTPEVTALIPDQVSTLHRLLGARGTSVRFRHGEENLLTWDVVIVDEASMVSLPLMAKLAVALKPAARLILLGDRDQLASVEAGAVLGDICGRGRAETFSPEFAGLLADTAGVWLPPESVTGSAVPLRDSLVVLRKNYRFTGESGIARTAAAVNAGDGATALGLLAGGLPGVGWRAVPRPDTLKGALRDLVVEGYGAYLRAGTPGESLSRFDAFRILCALRQGPYGVAGINSVIEEILTEEGLIDPHSRWYRGRPVMVTVNDYALKLFNGDIGMVFLDDAADGALRVFFPTPEGGIRKIAPVRLPAHETVFAMTVHKSQGSEFDRVLLLLPDTDSEVLSRELVYTGLTRVRTGVAVWGNEAAFVSAVGRRVRRDSGLEDELWPR